VSAAAPESLLGELAAEPPQRRRRSKGSVALWVVTILGMLYLFVPLITIAVFTFNKPSGKFNTTWEQFTFDNWLHPFKEEAFTNALVESLRVALIACTLATALGTLVALALSRYRMHGGASINMLLLLPITTPEIVMGASLFTLFFNQGTELGFWTIVIAHTGFCLSFVAMTLKARIRGFDWTLEDAAMDLGSPPLRTFVKITLPLILPGIVAAFMLSLALSIDDYIITSFIAGPVRTFPRQVFDASRVTIPPQAQVLATMIMLIAVIIIVGGTIISNRRQARG
jgi:spermidine/putrescine transport system permease protein